MSIHRHGYIGCSWNLTQQWIVLVMPLLSFGENVAMEIVTQTAAGIGTAFV